MHLAARAYALVVLACSVLYANAEVPLVLNLEANWADSPFALQVIEAVAADSPPAYFSLVTKLASWIEEDGPLSDREVHDRIIEEAVESGAVDRHDVPFIDQSIALHRYSALIQAQYQYFGDWADIASKECANVFVYNGKTTCDVDYVFALETISGSAAEKYNAKIELLPTDRIFQTNPKAPIAILYADILSPDFSSFHTLLVASAVQGKIQYVLRYKPSLDFTSSKESLTGYGAELDLKRTDYLVIDDRDQPEDDEDSKSKRFSYDDLRAATDDGVIAKSDLPLLGFRTAGYILSSPDPFEALVNVTLDFPKFSKALSKLSADRNVTHNAKRNMEDATMRAGENIFLVNGAPVLMSGQASVFHLLDAIDTERDLAARLASVAPEILTLPKAAELISDNFIGASLDDRPFHRYDYRIPSLVWLNDLVDDKRFQGWTSNPLAFLEPLQGPGQLHQVRRNLHSLVFAFDLSDMGALQSMLQGLTLLAKGIPLQIGIIPLAHSPEGELLSRQLHFITQYGTRSTATQTFFGGLISQLDPQTIFNQAVDAIEDWKLDKTHRKIDIRSESIDASLAEVEEWANRFDLENGERITFANGVVLEEPWSIMQAGDVFTRDVEYIREFIRSDPQIVDQAELRDVLLKGALKTRNSLLMSDASKLRYMNVVPLEQALKEVQIPEIVATADSSVEDSTTYTTVWILADFGSEEALQQLRNIVDYLQLNGVQGKKNIKVKVVPVRDLSKPSTEVRQIRCNAVVSALEQFNELDLDTIRQVLAELLSHHFGSKPSEKQHTQKLLKLGVKHDTAGDEDVAEKYYSALAQIDFEGVTLLVGGREIDIPSDRLLDASAIQFLVDYEDETRITPITEALSDAFHDVEDKFSIYDHLVSVYATTYFTDGESRRSPSKWHGENSTITVGDPSTALIHITAVIDPVSEEGQEYVAILASLSSLPVSMEIYLNPTKLESDDIPLKRFYRLSGPAAPEFDSDGQVLKESVSFFDLPQATLFTLGLKTPDAWIVVPSASHYDLDNIVLSSAASDGELTATYELTQLLLEGHSQDITLSQTPRGLALELSTPTAEKTVDTMVMSNLGYLQLKANPGLWRLAPKSGVSSEIYQLVSAGVSLAVGADKLWITKMTGLTIYPKFTRKRGMEDEDALNPSEKLKNKKSGSLWSRLTTEKAVQVEEHAEVNIFTVASGHLYERFLSIMTASVMQHAGHTVKFWLIENFLSPSFKEFLPHLAEKYGFKYELVTYKWPHWLRQQKEKQRIIWGYKILFLDTLFPQTLDKVIFVDSDQIVRTDLKELVDLDLHGAPYGYTPMCDSREEMEGFRFWKQGYWKDYLNGEPYHISALYVVDLERFRQLGAGDRLRSQYHMLSADPGSLANLDQDLPNNMQKYIPIYSLPQEWLWCETWCSDEALLTAKTIDLCNNPLTKEPKLDRARRQIPEWTTYDDEVNELRIKVSKLSEAAKNPPRSGPVHHDL